jgi:hypothetical protein
MKCIQSMLAISCLLPFAAFCWDGNVAGTIAGIDVATGPNYAFRVYLQGSPALCGNGNTWAYINKNNDNYAAYVATLLAAKATGAEIRLYTDREPSTGYCEIGYLTAAAP